MAENIIAAGSETRPSMLEKGMYDSWKTQTILYIRGKENGKMLKDLIHNGPYQFKLDITVKDTDGITDIRHPQRTEDLAGQDKLRYDSDIKAVNILFLGLPVDIYNLINHYQTAKEIWDHVKELMEGTDITKQERESMLYDEFYKFTSEPGESIHSYYMRYAAKQARDLHSVNFDQLYAFLKHNEKDAKESPPLQSYAPTVVQQPPTIQPDIRFVAPTFLPINDLIANLNKAMTFLISAYNSRYPTINNQLRTSSNQRTQATIQNGQVMIQNVQGRQSQGYAGNVGKNQASGARVVNIFGNARANQPRVLQAIANFKADHVDAYDSDCDGEASVNAIFMVNLSHVRCINDDTVELRYDSDILSENDMMLSVIEQMKSQVEKYNMENQKSKSVNESLTSELETYKDRVRLLEYAAKDGCSEKEAYLARELNTTISNRYQNPLNLSQARQKQPALYNAHVLIDKHNPISVCDSEETLILAEESRLKMLEKQTVVNNKPIDYYKLNKLYEYFVPQKELLAEQLYWSSTPSPPENVSKPTNIFPKKIPSTSQVLKNLNNARDLLSKFDECINRRTTLFPHQFGIWEQSDIKGDFKKDVMPFSENLKETFKLFEKGFIVEVKEMKDIFKHMEDEVDQCSMAKKCFKIEKKQLLIKNDPLLKESISSDIMCTYLRSLNEVDNYGKCKRTKLYSVTLLPKSKVISKVVEKNDLSKSITSQLTTNKIIEKCTKALAPGLLNIESKPINAYFKNNRVVYRDYLRVTKEHVATLQELLEQARALKPLDEHIGRVSSTNASGSKPRSNTKNDRILQPSSRSKKNKVEAHHRKFMSSANRNNYVLDCNANLKNVALSKNSDTISLSCNECLFFANHDPCVVKYLKKMQKRRVAKSTKQKVKSEWKPTGRFFTLIRLRWKPTGRMFNMEGKIIQTSPDTIVPLGNRLHTIRIHVVAPNVETRMRYSINMNSLIRAHINIYGHPLNPPKFTFIEDIVLWYLDYGCSKHITGHRNKLINFVSKFIGTVRFSMIILQLLWDIEIYRWGIFLFLVFTTLKDLVIIFFPLGSFVIKISK
ncbi:hypothetical protein Tco_0412938 [Tanacetum coccineum]